MIISFAGHSLIPCGAKVKEIVKEKISKRNDWMMKCADMIIAYVCHNSGGAYNSLKTAERYNKKIINIYDLI